MLGIGEKLPEFTVTGVKPKFMQHEQNGESAFEPITQDSFEGKWKVIFFYPKDFTFVCPTEIAEFARLSGDFEDRDAVVLGGSTDNEFVKLAWRRDHADLAELPIWQFGDTNGSLVDGLGIRLGAPTAGPDQAQRRPYCKYDKGKHGRQQAFAKRNHVAIEFEQGNVVQGCAGLHGNWTS